MVSCELKILIEIERRKNLLTTIINSQTLKSNRGEKKILSKFNEIRFFFFYTFLLQNFIKHDKESENKFFYVTCLKFQIKRSALSCRRNDVSYKYCPICWKQTKLRCISQSFSWFPTVYIYICIDKYTKVTKEVDQLRKVRCALIPKGTFFISQLVQTPIFCDLVFILLKRR